MRFEGLDIQFAQDAVTSIFQTSSEIPPFLGQEHKSPSHFPPFALETFATQLIWLAIFFGLFYLFVAHVATPRIGKVVNRRSEWLEEQRLAAELAQEKTERLNQSYEDALSDARTQAQKIIKDTHERLATENVEHRKLYDHDSKEKLKSAEIRVHSVKKDTLKDFSASSGEIAKLLVQRLTGITPTDSQVERVASARNTSF